MLSIIVAFDKNQLIGKDNKMPWHYKEDLKYFKNVTTDKKVVMGSKTFLSIINYLHKPLPNRENIVFTKHKEKYDKYSEIEFFDNINCFLAKYKKINEDIFIIGGKSIYEQFIDVVDRLYITHIEKEFKGDTHFPEFSYDDFRLVSEKKVDELRFCVYERKVMHYE